MITDGGSALVEVLSILLEALEWISKAPHLPGCQCQYGRIAGHEPKCSCGRTKLVWDLGANHHKASQMAAEIIQVKRAVMVQDGL